MSAIMIALNTVNPDETEALKAYAEGAMPLIKAVGGKPLGRFKFQEPVVGAEFPQVVLAVEFLNAQVIRDLFNSDAYKKLIPHRDKAFTSFNVCISQAE